MSFKEYSKDIGLDEKIANKLIDAVSNEKALPFEDVFGDLMESLLNPNFLERPGGKAIRQKRLVLLQNSKTFYSLCEEM